MYVGVNEDTVTNEDADEPSDEDGDGRFFVETKNDSRGKMANTITNDMKILIVRDSFANMNKIIWPMMQHTPAKRQKSPKKRCQMKSPRIASSHKS